MHTPPWESRLPRRSRFGVLELVPAFASQLAGIGGHRTSVRSVPVRFAADKSAAGKLQQVGALQSGCAAQSRIGFHHTAVTIPLHATPAG